MSAYNKYGIYGNNIIKILGIVGNRRENGNTAYLI